MKLVFALYKYFPFGGLQRDMLSIAQECARAGHEIHLFCQSWSGEYPDDQNIQINILKDENRWWRSTANHRKNQRFHQELAKAVSRIKPDLVVGFNRIPGIDIYYAADTCFKAKLYRERPWIYRFLPRYHSFVQEETALFSPSGTTHILAIAQRALDEYRNFYQTPAERFTLLPPGISRDRINSQQERLWLLHEELSLNKTSKILLIVGSGFRTKGLDRAIQALAALSEPLRQQTHLVVVGADEKAPFVEQAKSLAVNQNVHFLGGRKDIPQLLKSADLLIHPAYRENTGTVLLEAAVAGLPVLVTAVCGYATYIKEHGLGVVLSEPFDASQLSDTIRKALEDERQHMFWRNNAHQFAQVADIYDLSKRAVEAIEKVATKKGLTL